MRVRDTGRLVVFTFSWTQLYSSYRDEVMCKKSLMTSAGDDNFWLAPGSRSYLGVTVLTNLSTGQVPRHCTLLFQDVLSNAQALKADVTIIKLSLCTNTHTKVYLVIGGNDPCILIRCRRMASLTFMTL